MAVLGTIQPRALRRRLPLPDVLSGASRPPTSIPTRSSAAMRRWRTGWSTSSPSRRFLAGDTTSLADISLLALDARSRTEGGFHLDGYAAVRRWIGETEKLPRPAASALTLQKCVMTCSDLRGYHPPRAPRGRRRHRRHAGGRSARRRPASGSRPAAAILLPRRSSRSRAIPGYPRSSSPRTARAAVVGCLQLCYPAGAEFAGRLARPDRGCPRRASTAAAAASASSWCDGRLRKRAREDASWSNC